MPTVSIGQKRSISAKIGIIWSLDTISRARSLSLVEKIFYQLKLGQE
jgi:hypothetical protein